jgi:AAA domain
LSAQPADLFTRQCEAAHEILGDWYIRPDVAAAWQPVPLELFPDPRLRSIAEVANAGVPPDQLVLALQRNGYRQVWPRPGDADQFLLEIPGRGRPLEKQLAELKDIHSRRRLSEELLRAVHQVHAKDHDAIIAQLDATRPPDAQLTPFEATDLDSMFSPLGPEPWVCQALALQPGAPTMVSGHSGRGKSWLCYDLCLAVASGQDFSGLSVRRGRAHWYHLEGSARDLRRRMQHLARGRHLGPSDLRGWLVNVEHPNFLFTDPTLEKRLTVELSGATLAVIDSFAVAASGMKENDASIRQPLDMLARVSGKTGCAFIVIHHHRKDPSDPHQKVDEEMAVRGSGALLNAIAVGWAVTRVKRGDATDVLFRCKLTMTKSWYGSRDPLEVTGFFTPGIDGSVELSISSVDETETEDDRDFSELDNAILDQVQAHPVELNFTALYGFMKENGCRARRSAVAERVEVLRVQGRLVVESGSRGSKLIRPAGSAPPASGVRESGPTRSTDPHSNSGIGGDRSSTT